MDGNLIGMIVSLVLYLAALGIASAKKVNLGFISVISAVAALWFGYQWQQLLGVLAVIVSVFVGLFFLRALVGNKS